MLTESWRRPQSALTYGSLSSRRFLTRRRSGATKLQRILVAPLRRRVKFLVAN